MQTIVIRSVVIRKEGAEWVLSGPGGEIRTRNRRKAEAILLRSEKVYGAKIQRE